MSRIVKCGLIQMANKLDTSASCEDIRVAMLEAHLPLIEQAGAAGVQMLCFQEIFTGVSGR
jgi:N-carbamoylputrescine amidase